MSVELYIYPARTEAPGRVALAAALRKKGWAVLFLDLAGEVERTSGPLSDDLVLGGRSPAAIAKARKLLAKGGASEEIGSCDVSWTSPFDPRKEWGGDLDDLPPRVAALLLNAKSCGVVRTAAGRSDLSCDLQIAVWKALGGLAGGLLEDPQEGTYFRAGPRGGTKLSTPSEFAEVDLLSRYYKAAKAAGYAVVKEKDDVRLETETLSPSGLERLLKFTHAFFRKGDPSASALAMLILEEHERGKGPAFVRRHAKRLSELRVKYGDAD